MRISDWSSDVCSSDLCVVFEEDERGEIAKKIAGYHQFRAVRKARASVLAHLKHEGDGRGGVIWHTQGSGKSLTMLMLAGALIRAPRMTNPTVVMITDQIGRAHL